jgi:hypothetical protein
MLHVERYHLIVRKGQNNLFAWKILLSRHLARNMESILHRYVVNNPSNVTIIPNKNHIHGGVYDNMDF